MFLKFFLDLYDYLKGVLGLKSKEKSDIENNTNTTNIIQEEEEILLNNKNYEYNKEYNDEYKQYSPIELVKKNPYSRQANTIKQVKSDNIPKSHNELVKIFYCGYCSRYIPTPIHMYNDKAYCSSSCRNRQYDNDYQQQRHIRSVSSSF
jgi:hypothetical protein